jgi:uncharacterized protein YheU (UPF0270 family)
MIIPHSALKPDSLLEIIKDFLLSEEHLDSSAEVNLEQEIEKVKKLLEQEKLFIVYVETEEQPKLITKATCRELGLLK